MTRRHLRLTFAVSGLAGAYLVTLFAATRFGLGLGLSQLSAPGSLHPAVSYRADMPFVAAAPRTVPFVATIPSAAWEPAAVVTMNVAAPQVSVPPAAPASPATATQAQASIPHGGHKRAKRAGHRVARAHGAMGKGPADDRD